MVEEEEMLDVEEQEETSTPPAPRPASAKAQGSGLVASAWKAQDSIERRWDRLGKGRFARVLKMARKPEPEEFRQSALVVLVGIAVIGLMGFLMYLFTRTVLNVLGAGA